MRSGRKLKWSFKVGDWFRRGIDTVGRLFEPAGNLSKVKALEIFGVKTREAQVSSFRTPDPKSSRSKRERPAISIQREPWPIRFVFRCKGHDVSKPTIVSMVFPYEPFPGRGCDCGKRPPVPGSRADGVRKLIAQSGCIYAVHPVVTPGPSTCVPGRRKRSYPSKCAAGRLRS